METMIEQLQQTETISSAVFSKAETNRITAMTALLPDDEAWLKNLVKNKHFSQEEIAIIEDMSPNPVSELWKEKYIFKEYTSGSRSLASDLAMDYFTDLTEKIKVDRYKAYQEYLEKIMEKPILNQAFQTTLKFRINEEKLKVEITGQGLSEEERTQKREDLQRLVLTRIKYQHGLEEPTKTPICPEANNYKKTGKAVPREHIDKCAICEKYEQQLQITGKKI